MADYPGQLHTQRTLENLPGIVFDSGKSKTFFAEDITLVNDEVIAVQTALGLNPQGGYADVVSRLDENDALMQNKAGLIDLPTDISQLSDNNSILLTNDFIFNEIYPVGTIYRCNAGDENTQPIQAGMWNYIGQETLPDNFIIYTWVRVG